MGIGRILDGAFRGPDDPHEVLKKDDGDVAHHQGDDKEPKEPGVRLGFWFLTERNPG